MVSIYHTANGWTFRILSEMGYYNSLAEVMDAAYATQDRAADHDGVSAVRNRPCHDCRFAKGSPVPGTCQGNKARLP